MPPGGATPGKDGAKAEARRAPPAPDRRQSQSMRYEQSSDIHVDSHPYGTEKIR